MRLEGADQNSIEQMRSVLMRTLPILAVDGSLNSPTQSLIVRRSMRHTCMDARQALEHGRSDPEPAVQ